MNEFTKEQIVIVKSNNQKAVVVGEIDELVMIEFEDGSQFSYPPEDLELFLD